MFIGSEGTLGIITAASLKLFTKPKSQAACFLVIRDPSTAIELFEVCRDKLDDQISAFELISKVGLDFLKEVGPEVRAPFSDTPEWMILIDVSCNREGSAQQILEDVFVEAYDRNLVTDGVISQSLKQRDDFWNLRESIPEANHRIGAISSSDISFPTSVIPEFITKADLNLSKIGDFRINCFGHIGDGNLHYNVFPLFGESRIDRERDREKVKLILYELVHDLGGSFSAEHGIGRLKVDELDKYSDSTKMGLLKLLKNSLDPKGIMNPGVMFSP
jgi:FAD/FMN-containing dehydrogenase